MQITIETRTTTIIRQPHARRGWCRECAREVDMVGIEQATIFSGMTQPVLRHCAETQE